ncbi:carboxymuconolactone decarboxylase family protein [Streptomyces sp. NBC_00385]|uniref:carboxymuconolactone decarboxylase family protein n=1 Tax=Streptomyces sp. NBC_00385 TaxID=2975733 RepID=UPI002DD7BA12|nr:carboxymuconolactone decarboxylase family protein [Streptomyces sp. NBC_00385]WRZ01956.1 carboxymuconolactone decarboxylase family protein [Streptomyces sp. NBC_00385]
MYDSEWQEAARAVRAEVIGGGGTQEGSDGGAPTGYRDYVTATAWGVWARGGPLSTRDRSLLVLAMTAATARMNAFRIHLAAASRAGVTDAEVDELLYQLTAYCGAPAGIDALAVIREVREARDAA